MNEMFKDIKNKVSQTELLISHGKIVDVSGLVVGVRGLSVPVGEICEIFVDNNIITAEVVGFNRDKTLLMPLGEMSGISPGDKVVSTGHSLKIGVGESLLGRVLSGLGYPIDGKPVPKTDKFVSVYEKAPDPLKRDMILQHLSVGVKAIDGCITLGKGQRIGIFSGSGVGKSTLLGMMARNTEADINVIALVGERGREVRDFIEKSLGEEGLKRSVVVVATSDQPALLRVKAVMTATAIAEYFRGKGKDVLLMMDSITRFAMAQREIGLSVGEPPTTKGYPPSVFSMLPKFLERAGTDQNGSITGLYTVLVDADDMNEPISDAARSILDGHIVLSRKIAASNHWPAIDILNSLSRVMPDIVSLEHLELNYKLRELLSAYNDAEDLINIGAYVDGTNNRIDTAKKKIEAINTFLCQTKDQKYTFEEIVDLLKKVFGG